MHSLKKGEDEKRNFDQVGLSKVLIFVSHMRRKRAFYAHTSVGRVITRFFIFVEV